MRPDPSLGPLLTYLISWSAAAGVAALVLRLLLHRREKRQEDR